GGSHAFEQAHAGRAFPDRGDASARVGVYRRRQRTLDRLGKPFQDRPCARGAHTSLRPYPARATRKQLPPLGGWAGPVGESGGNRGPSKSIGAGQGRFHRRLIRNRTERGARAIVETSLLSGKVLCEV